MSTSQSAPIFSDIIVHIVRFRADGDVSFLGALARKIISRGGRITNRVAKDCTHVIFQEKPCCSASEKALEEAKLRELFNDKLDKLDLKQAPHVISPLWVQESLNLGRLADEQEFSVKRPSAPAIWLHSASSSAADPSGSSKQPRRKSASSATATAAALLSSTSLAPAPLVSLLMDDVNDALMFSSSQAIHEADGGRLAVKMNQPNRIDKAPPPPPPPKWSECPRPEEDALQATTKDEDLNGSRKRTREELPGPPPHHNVTRRSSLGPSSVSALLSRALSTVVSPPKLLNGTGSEAKKRRSSSNHATPRTTPLNSPRDLGMTGIVVPKVKQLTDQGQIVDLIGSKNDEPSSSLEPKGSSRQGEGLNAEKENSCTVPGQAKRTKMTDFFPPASTKATSAKSIQAKDTKVCLSYSSVDPQTMELVKTASRKLGCELCSEGQEEQTMTHLIVGPDPKRTIKLLVAISRGCHIVKGCWLSESLAAGRLLEIQDSHRSPSCYSQASDRVRESRKAEGKFNKLLEGQSVYLWPTREDAFSRVKGKHRQGIERVVFLLGGTLASLPHSAHVCIQMAGAEGEPLKETCGTRWVKEEWLLQMAERQETIDIDRSYYVH